MNKLRLNKKETICWSVLILFSLLSTIKMAQFCLSGGILNPDVSLYLITGLKYAGMDFYNILNPEHIYYTPIISFLSSLLFRLGLVDKAAIIIVTSILCFLSYIGLYMLLKLRFNSLLSLAGVILYGSTSIIIFNLSKGLIDIPSISISIWALYFGIIAIDKDPKYFLIAFPLLVIGFFTKYIAGFILPLIFLYYFMNKNIVNCLDDLISDKTLFKSKFKQYIFSKELKYIVVAIFISLILTIIICKTLILDYGGYLTFFDQSLNTFNTHASGTVNNLVSVDKSFYFDEFHNILFEKQEFGLILSGILYSIFIIGMFIQAYNFIKNKLFKSSKKSFKTKYLDKLLGFILIFSVIGTIYGFKILENNMLSNICFLISVIIIHSIIKNYLEDDKCLKFTLLYFAFFMVYFIFLSLYPLKIYRYSLPLIIPFICIIVWSFDSILNLLTNKFDNFKCKFNNNYSKISNCILICIIIIFLFSTITFMAPMKYERSNDVYQEVLYKGYSNDLVDVCDYIMETDSNYHSKSFASFPNPTRTMMWYLKVNATVLEEDDPNLDDFDNSTYLISYMDLSLNNYHLIHRCGDFRIYYHN